jgi:hypothetical protein
MIHLCLDCFFESWKDIFSLGALVAQWATVIGVAVAIAVALCVWKTYKSNNSIRKWELIEKTYDVFIKDGWYEFYKRIQNGEQIDLENKNEEKLLNETLTLFDALNYFQTQKLLDEKAWEYVACEIQNFALNNSVWEYMHKIKEPYLVKGFPEKIIPFTGFPELFGELPKKFKAKCPPQLENRFNLLSQEEKNLYYNKVKYIPDKLLELKQTAAIVIFAKAKVGTEIQ